MSWEPIAKSPRRSVVAPNLADCGRARAEFSWEKARASTLERE
jgi:hypothetical protein